MYNIIVKNQKSSIDQSIRLPMREQNLQEYCDALGIANDMKSKVTVTEVMAEQNLAGLLVEREYNLEELNFLSKRLGYLNELNRTTFYAVASAEKLSTAKDLINLTYNTNCYSLVGDFSDLNKLGKSLYQNEQGTVSEAFLQEFDGQKYVEDLMAQNPKPLPSPLGFIYPNKNIPTEHYNGKTLPLFFQGSPHITLELRALNNNEYLFLPCEESELNKALERLDSPSLEGIELSIYDYSIPDNIMKIGQSDDFYKLNEFARLMQRVGKSEHMHLSKLVTFTKTDNIADLETLAKAMYEFEIIPKVHNDYEYGYHMITRTDRFEYDENLADYIDFERYGRERNSMNGSIYTEHGYLNYLGYNTDMCDILNKNLGMRLEIEPYAQTIRLYMPLEVTTYYEEDYYGHYRQTDYEGTLDSKELCGYEDELNEFIVDHQPEMETERGLMEYYGKADTVNTKVKSYHFEFEELGGNVYGVVVAKLNAPLDAHELESFRSLCEGQASDGVGEGLEQREFHLAGRDVYIHLWQSDKGWYMKTAEEMGFEQAQGYEMKMM